MCLVHIICFTRTELTGAAAGAVLYAQSPSTIYARRCKFAYGVETAHAWHFGMPLENMFIEPTTQRRLCGNYFESIVALDQLIEHDQVLYPVPRQAYALLWPHGTLLQAFGSTPALVFYVGDTAMSHSMYSLPYLMLMCMASCAAVPKLLFCKGSTTWTVLMTGCDTQL